MEGSLLGIPLSERGCLTLMIPVQSGIRWHRSMSTSADVHPLRDARRQSVQVRLQRQQEVVRLHGQGVPVMDIVRQSGLCWRTVRRAIDRERQGAVDPLAVQHLGQRPGPQPALGGEKALQVRQVICSQSPKSCGLEGNLWCRATVRQLIERRCSLAIAERTVSKYLNTWGVEGGPSARNLQDACVQQVRQWLDDHKDEIAAKRHSGDWRVYWLNAAQSLDPEMWVQPDSEGKIGKRATLASVTNQQGKFLWRVLPGRFDACNQRTLLRALIEEAHPMGVVLIKNTPQALGGNGVPAWISARPKKLLVYPNTLEGAPLGPRAVTRRRHVYEEGDIEIDGFDDSSVDEPWA